MATVPGEGEEVKKPSKAAQKEEPSTGKMHQNVPEWSDPVCACEAEPYWQAVGEEEEEKKEESDSEPC